MIAILGYGDIIDYILRHIDIPFVYVYKVKKDDIERIRELGKEVVVLSDVRDVENSKLRLVIEEDKELAYRYVPDLLRRGVNVLLTSISILKDLWDEIEESSSEGRTKVYLAAAIPTALPQGRLDIEMYCEPSLLSTVLEDAGISDVTVPVVVFEGNVRDVIKKCNDEFLLDVFISIKSIVGDAEITVIADPSLEGIRFNVNSEEGVSLTYTVRSKHASKVVKALNAIKTLRVILGEGIIA